MFVLDTNVLSELRRPDKTDLRVQAWAATHPLNHFYLSAITIMELERYALIAATALVHGMTVATRNVADFAPTGVAVFNPWTES